MTRPAAPRSSPPPAQVTDEARDVAVDQDPADATGAGAPAAEPPQTSGPPGMTAMRADKWLWHARFFKTRGLAAKVISGGHLRVNATKVHKPAQSVRPGDVLTFPQARRIRVVQIVALSERRGPAPEAQALYADMTPDAPTAPPNPGFDGKGRPGGKDRRKAREFGRSQLE